MLVWLKLYTPCCISLKIFSCKISWLLIWTPNKFNTQMFFSCLWRGMPPSSALHVVVPWRPDVLTLESHEEMLILHIKPRFGVLNWPKEGPLRDHQLQTCGQNFSLNHTHTQHFATFHISENASKFTIFFGWPFRWRVLSSPLGVQWLPIPHDRWFHQNQRNSLKRKGMNR